MKASRLVGSQQGRVIVATISDSYAALEKYLAASSDDKPEVLAELLADLRTLLAEGGWAAAAAIVQRALLPSSDFTTFQSLYRIYSKLKPHVDLRPKTRLAILGGFTTTQLAQAIELALFSMGGGVEIFEADYGVYRQEILDPNSELYRFQPNIVLAGHQLARSDPPPGHRNGAARRSPRWSMRNLPTGRPSGARPTTAWVAWSCRTVSTGRRGVRWTITRCGIRQVSGVS